MARAHPAAGLDRSRPPAPGPLRPFHFPRVERRTLSNGMPVVMAPAYDFPVVTVHVLLEAGGIREEPARAGLAALTAALLETGAGGRSAAEIAEELEALGVQFDTGATWDAAHASLTALRSRVEAAGEILGDVVRRPTFDPAEVERLRAERLAEILQHRADPRMLATEAAAAFVYSADTPFSRPLGGRAATVEGLTRQDVVAFHAEHFLPGGAAIVVAGDLAPEPAIELLEARFGDWAGAAAPLREVPVAPRTRERQVVIINRPGAPQSEIRVGHLGVARSTEDYFPLLVMNAILGGTFSSRLNLNLRERHGFTYGASSGFSMRRRPGSFMVSTAVQTEVTAPAVREILRELDAIRDAPVRDAELHDARNYLAGVFPLCLQTTDGIASRLAELVVYDLPDDYFDTYAARILAVDVEEVQRAAQQHVRPAELAIVVVGDAERLQPELATLDLAPVQVIEPAELDRLAG